MFKKVYSKGNDIFWLDSMGEVRSIVCSDIQKMMWDEKYMYVFYKKGKADTVSVWNEKGELCNEVQTGESTYLGDLMRNDKLGICISASVKRGWDWKDSILVYRPGKGFLRKSIEFANKLKK